MKLILGTVQFGLEYGVFNQSGKPDKAEIFNALDYAWDVGIKTLDTAEAYGDANSIISDYHASRTHRFSIINKIMRHTDEDVIENLIHGLHAMRIPTFSCIMFHHAAAVPQKLNNQFWLELKNRRITGSSGLSFDDIEEYRSLEKRFLFDIVQTPINIFNRSAFFSQLSHASNENFPLIHARSVFLQGALINDPERLPSHLIGLKNAIIMFQSNCHGLGITPMVGALLPLVHDKRIEKIVVGAQNQTQLEEINLAYSRACEARDILPYLEEFALENPELSYPVNWNRYKANS